MISFFIEGEPKGKERPQFNGRAKNKRFAYTPKGTRTYESTVKREYKKQVGTQKFPDNMPLYLEVTAFLKIPKSVSKVKRQKMIDGKILPLKRPDTDNIVKIVADALNKVAYKDDKQITDHRCKKRYGERIGVLVMITEMET